MDKIIIAPDSFKGTLSSAEACQAMAKAAKAVFPHAEILLLPVADGGEGTVDAMLHALGGKKVCVSVTGPHFTPVRGFYGQIGNLAVVEMAAAAGLCLAEGNLNPEKTTTFGVGELMDKAIAAGAEKILLGLGGSATNDGGCGAAAALGAKFYDGEGKAFVPVGGSMKNIAKIDVSALKAKISGVEITAMCDIENPLWGGNGAAFVFAPQKGADAAMVKRLDAGLAHLAAVAAKDLGIDMQNTPGAGAAGGMGGGAAAFFGAKLTPGIDGVLDAAAFETVAAGADLLLTGEGRIDGQTLGGKAIAGIARRAKALGVPVAVIAGDVSGDISRLYGRGVAAVFSTNREAKPFEAVRNRAGEDLAIATENVLRLWKLAQK